MSGARLLSLEPGKRVSFQDKGYRITRILSLSEVELVDEQSLEIIKAGAGELNPPVSEAKDILRPDLTTISDEAWEFAKSRLAIIKPLLDDPLRTRSAVAAAARRYGVHTNTLYTWIRAYEGSGALSSLLPRSRSDRGTTKLDPEVEEVIRESIAAEYLTKQKKSQQEVCKDVRRRCKKQGLPAPHANTIRNRIKALPAELVAVKRHGRKTADLKFRPLEGTFPGADWPLSVVQIDHTEVDIILVEDHYRRPIGRPWITLSFDVCTRMVTGFYISFDPPSALSTGLCLAHSFLPKSKWLSKHKTANDWPIWGLPDKVLADNAKEFRGKMLTRACDDYGIDLEWRPVRKPRYGAHIERNLGTFLEEIHTLPGTTFSNPKQKGEYESEKESCFTLSEFESWLTIHIVDVYHQRLHSKLGTFPIAAYQKGIMGDDETPGRGLPEKVADEDRLRLDFMPFELRSVLNYGVQIDEVHYHHDVLRRWIDAPDPEEPKKKRKFIFRRDPRDISVIWFYDPELQMYYAIPYRDTSHPPVSIWELREAKRRVKRDGQRHISEDAIFDAIERMREIEQQAVEKTKKARRAVQRRKQHSQIDKPMTKSKVAAEPPTGPGETVAPIEPFDEMDDMS